MIGLVARTSANTAAFMPALIRFGYLQVLDLLTTMAVLSQGGAEANPVVRWLMQTSGSSVLGLLAAKLIGVGLGICCVRRNNLVLLERVSAGYAILIAWNLLMLVLAGALGR